MRRTSWFELIALILAFPASALCRQQNQAQQSGPPAQAAAPQQESLADAARRARAQKKETPKTPKVFTNDNLPAQGGVSTVGESPANASGENASGSGEATAASAAGAQAGSNEEKTWRDKFAALRRKQAQDEQELEVMQRELSVLDVQNYSDPVKAMQQQLTRKDINDKTAKIEAKKKAIEADKQAISDAEDDLRKAGGDTGWAR